MSGQALLDEMSSKVRLLDAAVKELGNRGRVFARAEHDYRIALAQRVMMEREKGTPVTIVADVCRGDRETARLRFERDVAEVVYKSAQEAINSYKLQIRIMESQIQREWGVST